LPSSPVLGFCTTFVAWLIGEEENARCCREIVCEEAESQDDTPRAMGAFVDAIEGPARRWEAAAQNDAEEGLDSFDGGKPDLMTDEEGGRESRRAADDRIGRDIVATPGRLSS
jgi:hypothetical protein